MTTTRIPNTPVRKPRRLRDLKSVPVLPSLMTLGGLFLGFLAMAKVADAIAVGDVSNAAVIRSFELAAMFVFFAMVFDSLDGFVARMTNQTSRFGAQLDSLADVVTFGVAPAFIAKILINLHERPPVELLPVHPKIYYFCAAIFVLCAAMRLARFNVETTSAAEDHEEFRGLPTPGAAALVCAMVAFYTSRDDTNNIITRALLPDTVHDWMVVAMPATLVCLGLLMVSRVPYPHFAYALLRRRHSFPFLATLVVLIGLIAIEWQLALLVLAVSYAVAGIVIGLIRIVTTGRMEDPPDPDGDDADFPARSADPKLN